MYRKISREEKKYIYKYSYISVQSETMINPTGYD